MNPLRWAAVCALIWSVLITVSCTLTPEHSAQLELDERFTYRKELVDDWEYLAEQGQVSGDCEEYAMTLQLKIGGELWLINGGTHMVLVKDGLVYENRKRPYSSDKIKGKHEVISPDFARVRAITDSLK